MEDNVSFLITFLVWSIACIVIVVLIVVLSSSNTHIESRAGRPNAPLEADDGSLGDLARSDEVGVYVALPRHLCLFFVWMRDVGGGGGGGEGVGLFGRSSGVSGE